MAVESVSGDKPADLAAKLWGVKELAEVFSVKESTISRWRRQGKLPKPTGPGRRPMWSASEIRKLVNATKD